MTPPLITALWITGGLLVVSAFTVTAAVLIDRPEGEHARTTGDRGWSRAELTRLRQEDRPAWGHLSMEVLDSHPVSVAEPEAAFRRLTDGDTPWSIPEGSFRRLGGPS